jgi:hypothetical protein
MVIEVASETRKKLLGKKLKIGWLICRVYDCLVARSYKHVIEIMT